MYILYTDKSEDFKCHIGVQGANLSTTKARLILENKNINLIFEGKINQDGTCIIPIKKLKGILQEGMVGNMKLEVIADETFFPAWEDEFTVKTNKKVVVEVENDETKNLISEDRIQIQVEKQLIPHQPKRTHSETLVEMLKIKGIKKDNIKKNINLVSNLIEKYTKTYDINISTDKLCEEILNKIK